MAWFRKVASIVLSAAESDPEQRWLAFGQCGECNQPDRIMSQVNGLCCACEARLRSDR